MMTLLTEYSEMSISHKTNGCVKNIILFVISRDRPLMTLYDRGRSAVNFRVSADTFASLSRRNAFLRGRGI